MMYATKKALFSLPAMTLGLAFLFIGCGQAPQEAQDELAVRVYAPTLSECASIYAGEGGGGPTKPSKAVILAATSKTAGEPGGGTGKSMILAATTKTAGEPGGGTGKLSVVMAVAKDDGGHGGGHFERLIESSCNSYVVEVSGSTAQADSVLISLGDEEWVVSLDASEEGFVLQWAAEDLPTIESMTLTPMLNGELGSVLNIDVTDLL